MSHRPHVVILGAGFGGLGAVRELRDANVHVTIVDQNDFHTFQPLLYQVATDELAPNEVATPIREVLHRHDNVSFHRAPVERIDLATRDVWINGMPPLPFDYLVVALGAVVNFHDTPGAAEHSFPLYSMHDAIRLHDHILNRFESVDENPSLADDGALTFCIVGGGPTGTELAGALAELVQEELVQDYPQLPMEKVRILLYEHSPHLLSAFRPKLRDYARSALEERKVEVKTGIGVQSIDSTSVTLTTGEVVKSQTLVWAAGLSAHPISQSLGIPLATGGRIPVLNDLQVDGAPAVFAVGDIAEMHDCQSGQPLPGLGAVALQAGHHAGRNIARLVRGQATEPFHYRDKGTMAQVGHGAAVVQLPNGRSLTGYPAWLAWLGVHLCLLSGAEERTSVFVDWGWNILTHRRGKRILFGDLDA